MREAALNGFGFRVRVRVRVTVRVAHGRRTPNADAVCGSSSKVLLHDQSVDVRGAHHLVAELQRRGSVPRGDGGERPNRKELVGAALIVVKHGDELVVILQ
jgi:hypothetical protein